MSCVEIHYSSLNRVVNLATQVTLTGLQLLVVMLGGGLGAVARYMVSTSINEKVSSGFPFGTLTVNVVGSFAMGFLAMWLVENLGLNPLMRLAIFVGFLGAFTTFSTFSMETLNLFEEGFVMKAFLNMFVNVALSVLAVWLGMMLGKQLS